MATEKQKKAARKNIKKAQEARHRTSPEMTQDQRDRLADEKFAFPRQRKEPLNDAEHVRNAVARFDQVTDVSEADRAEAWKRIKAAAKRYDVELSESSWKELMRN